MKSQHCYGDCVNTQLPVPLAAKAFLNKWTKKSQCNSLVSILCIPARCWVASSSPPVALAHGPRYGDLTFSL